MTRVVLKKSNGRCQVVANGSVGSCHPPCKALRADGSGRVRGARGSVKLAQDELLLKTPPGGEKQKMLFELFAI